MKQKIVVSVGAFFLLIFVTSASVFLTGCSRKEPDFFISGESRMETGSSETEPKAEIQLQLMQESSGQGSENISDAETVASASDEVLTKTESMIYVDVCGAVANPNVYQFPENSRVFQAIEAAGGMTEDAAQGYLNLAQVLTDGQQIYVPTKEEVESLDLSIQSADNNVTEAANVSENSSTKVNLNTADAETLMTLSGIGESKALAIIAYRDEQGGFHSVEELMNVPGIKEGTFSKIKENIAIE